MTIRDSLSAPKGCVVAPSRGGSDRCLAELTRVDCTRGDVLAKALTMSKLNDLMTRGTELLGSDYAILCGAMSWVSERNLVSAISNAGGFGVIACGALTTELLDAEIRSDKRSEGKGGVRKGRI